MMWGCLLHSSRSTSASKRWRASMAPSAWCQGRRNWTGIAELRKSQLSGAILGSFRFRKALHFFAMWEFCMAERQIGANRPDIYHPSSTCQVSSEPRRIQRCFHRADRFHGTSTKHCQRGCNISVRNWLQRRLTQDALTQMIENHGKAFTGTELSSEELVMIEDPMLSMKDCREVPEIVEMPSEKREGSVTPSNAERYIDVLSARNGTSLGGWFFLPPLELYSILDSFFHIPLSHTHWKTCTLWHWQERPPMLDDDILGHRLASASDLRHGRCLVCLLAQLPQGPEGPESWIGGSEPRYVIWYIIIYWLVVSNMFYFP